MSWDVVTAQHLVIGCQEHEGIHSLRACHLLSIHAVQVHLIVVRGLLCVAPPLVRLRQPVQCNPCKAARPESTMGQTTPFTSPFIKCRS